MIFRIGLSLTSDFRVDTWNVLSSCEVFPLDRQPLVLPLMLSSFLSFHLLSAMLFAIVYLQLWFECTVWVARVNFHWLFFFFSRHYLSRWVVLLSLLNCLIQTVDLLGSSVQHLVKLAVDPTYDSSAKLHIHHAASSVFHCYILLWLEKYIFLFLSLKSIYPPQNLVCYLWYYLILSWSVDKIIPRKVFIV